MPFARSSLVRLNEKKLHMHLHYYYSHKIIIMCTAYHAFFLFFLYCDTVLLYLFTLIAPWGLIQCFELNLINLQIETIRAETISPSIN